MKRIFSFVKKNIIFIILIFVIIFLSVWIFLLKREECPSSKFLFDSQQFNYISSSSTYIPEAIEQKFIKKVRDKVLDGGNTIGEELQASFPSIPLSHRTWEVHRIDDEIYICYVLRINIGGIPFIWRYNKEQEKPDIVPENGLARALDYGNGEIAKFDEKLKKVDKLSSNEKKVFLFYSNRSIDRFSSHHYICFVSKKYSIPKEDAKRILLQFFPEYFR